MGLQNLINYQANPPTNEKKKKITQRDDALAGLILIDINAVTK